MRIKYSEPAEGDRTRTSSVPFLHPTKLLVQSPNPHYRIQKTGGRHTRVVVANPQLIQRKSPWRSGPTRCPAFVSGFLPAFLPVFCPAFSPALHVCISIVSGIAFQRHSVSAAFIHQRSSDLASGSPFGVVGSNPAGDVTTSFFSLSLLVMSLSPPLFPQSVAYIYAATYLFLGPAGQK